jgi:hypothetical protein
MAYTPMQAGDKESFVMFPSARSAGGRSERANPGQ